MPLQLTRINTDISPSIDRQTGSGFGGNLLRAFGMMQQGQQANRQMDFAQKQAAAQQLDKERTYKLLETNLMNEQADKDALQAIITETNGDIEKLDDNLTKFAPKSLFGIKAHGVLQNQTKTHLMEKKAAQTKNYWNDTARKNLNPDEYLTWVNTPDNPETGLPDTAKANWLTQRVLAKEAAKAKPLSTIGKIISDRDAVAASGGDTTAFDNALAKAEKSSDVVFREEMIGGKPVTIMTQPGYGGVRVFQHDTNNKLAVTKLQEAYRIKRDALKVLSDPKKTIFADAKAQAQSTLEKAESDILKIEEELAAAPVKVEAEMVAPVTPQTPSSTQYPSATNPKTGEKLIFKDGKWQKP